MEAADGCEFIGHGVAVFKDDLGGEVRIVARDFENLEDGVVLALLEDRGFGEPAVLEAAAVGGQAGRRGGGVEVGHENDAVGGGLGERDFGVDDGEGVGARGASKWKLRQ